jgi:hypothetical protein
MDGKKFTTLTVDRESEGIMNDFKKEFADTLGGSWSHSKVIKELKKIAKSKK